MPNRLISITIAILAPLLSAAQGQRIPVIPVEFSDASFQNRQTGVVEKISRARDYFNDQFSPKKSFSFDILPTVKLSRSVDWYGANSTSLKDARADDIVREAFAALKTDFSVYDNDGDGYIDNICIIAAGRSEADGYGADRIWPQHIYMHDRSGTVMRDGKTADSYTICVESSSLGVFCHEFGHSFGLQDLYDTDDNGSGGTTAGVWGSLSLMDKGSGNNGGDTPPNFCAIELEQLGLGNPIELKRGYHRLRPISQSKEYLRIDTDIQDEYFLLECRDKSGWDAYAGGSGLVIYHIDKSSNNSWYSDIFGRNLTARERWQYNQVNCRPDHPCARVLSAIPGTRTISGVFFPQPGRTTISAETDPALKYWSGDTSPLALTGIETDSDGSVSFNVITPMIMREMYVFQDAAILSWSTDNTLDVQSCDISWHAEGDNSYYGTKTATADRVSDEHFSKTIENLSPATSYTVRIRVLCKDGSVFSHSMEFSTKSRPKGMKPFIYLTTLSRQEDGSCLVGDKLPLRVYNSSGAVRVQWYFDDMRIVTERDGFWYIPYSGVLKAQLWYSDGSSDIIIKKLNAR